jgi:RNA polymerase sigma factor (sigma-70 family)
MQCKNGVHKSAVLAAAFAESRPKLITCINASIPSAMRSAIDAEDILQDAWVAATQGAWPPSFAGPEDAQAWITAVALATLHKAIRSRHARKHSGGVATESLDRTDAGLAAVAEAAWRRLVKRSDVADAIQQALARLSPDRREVIQLWMQGVATDDIGAKLKRTSAAVNSLLFKARRQLRPHLAGMPDLSWSGQGDVRGRATRGRKI